MHWTFKVYHPRSGELIGEGSEIKNITVLAKTINEILANHDLREVSVGDLQILRVKIISPSNEARVARLSRFLHIDASNTFNSREYYQRKKQEIQEKLLAQTSES